MTPRPIQCATYLKQLNHMRKSLIAQHAREQAQDDQLALAIDQIASVIVALGGTVADVPGYDCHA